jgi:hypothetical protein
MNLLLNLSPSYRESFIAGNVAGVDETIRGGARRVPPYAEMLGSLEVLRQSDPVLYRQVKREVDVSLEAARPVGRDSRDVRDWVKIRRRGDRGLINARAHFLMERVTRLAGLLFPASAHH